jgi:hypothetical protein
MYSDDEYENYDDEKRSSRSGAGRRSRSSEDEDGNQTINIRPFDFNTMPPFKGKGEEDGTKIIIIGKAGSGKSSLIKDILAAKAHLIPVAQVFSGTEDSNHAFASIVPDVCLFNKLDTKAMEEFKKRQKIAKQWLKFPWALQVIDDCTDDPKILKKPIFQDFYKNGRHWAMLHILTLQYCNLFDIVFYIFLDYFFVSKFNLFKISCVF